MLKIDSLQLPPKLPSDEVIKSFGKTSFNYDPIMWELEYEGYRYLENLGNEKLEDRYRCIVKNLTRLVSRERDIIPIDSGLSSWYWYRKEHQTRFEFHMRGESVPINPPESVSSSDYFEMPARPRAPNAGDVLFRFGKAQHMVPIVDRGEVRIGPASKYIQGTPEDPRVDDELQKHSFLAGKYTTVTHQSGEEIPIIGDLKQTVTTQNYYVLCMACGYHPKLFDDFVEYDTCVVVHNGKEFVNRIQQAAQSVLPGWYFHHHPVHYFDPHEPRPKEAFDAVMCKDFKFAYQMEYRLVWLAPEGGSATDYKYLNLGPLQDISWSIITL